MPPTFPQLTSLPTSSLGRRGADARLVSSSAALAGRASETVEQSIASVEDIVRREPDFAEPGERAHRERAERWPDGRMVMVTIAVVSLLVALVATATALIIRWFA